MLFLCPFRIAIQFCSQGVVARYLELISCVASDARCLVSRMFFHRVRVVVVVVLVFVVLVVLVVLVVVVVAAVAIGGGFMVGAGVCCFMR